MLGESNRGAQNQSIDPFGGDEGRGLEVPDQPVVGDERIVHATVSWSDVGGAGRVRAPVWWRARCRPDRNTLARPAHHLLPSLPWVRQGRGHARPPSTGTRGHDPNDADRPSHARPGVGRAGRRLALPAVGGGRLPDAGRRRRRGPRSGSKLHHSVGAWPLLIDDDTEVARVRARARVLALRARGWPIGEAEVDDLRSQPQGADTAVVIERGRRLRPGRAGPEPVRAPCAEVAQHRDPAPAGLPRRAARGTPADGTYDAVVVGAGPNGLVAANHLARRRAGRCWSWRRSRTSAARCAATGTCTRTSCTTRSARSTRWPRPRPRCRSFGLEEHGLRLAARPGGARATRRRTGAGRCCTATATSPPRCSTTSHPGDGEAWLELCAQWDRIGDAPRRRAAHARSRRCGAGLGGAGAAAPRAGGLDFVRDAAHPGRRPRPRAVRRRRPAAAAGRQRRARRHPPRRARAPG